LSGAPPPIVQATSCCTCPCYTFGGTQFKALLSPFALQLRIALCFCGVPLKLFAFSQACLASVMPRALTASLWQRLHPHGFSLQLCIASCSCGIPLAMLPLSQASKSPIDNLAAIVVGLPLLLGCHHCQAAIVALLPRATSKHPIYCCPQATLLPYSLGLPPNTPFVIAFGCCCCPCHVTNLPAYPADLHCFFIHLV
jgi:hypothetical protein